MKIIIGCNTFKSYHRQDIAVQSWELLKEQFSEIELYDVQFKDEEKNHKKLYDNLNTIFSLERSSADLKDHSKKLPFVNDIMFSLSELECDYFIFTNSDVIINKNLIKEVLNGEINALACSRLDIQDIKDIKEYIDRKISPVRWEIAGFDTFVFKKEWFLNNKHRFNDYFLGKPEFDGSYSFICKVFGGNFPLGNSYPPYCFHIHHGLESTTIECVEREFNQKTRDSNIDKEYCGVMGDHLKKNLMRRQPWGAFLYPHPEEKEFEKQYFEEVIKKYNK
jgi:hypothetical protein